MTLPWGIDPSFFYAFVLNLACLAAAGSGFATASARLRALWTSPAILNRLAVQTAPNWPFTLTALAVLWAGFQFIGDDAARLVRFERFAGFALLPGSAALVALAASLIFLAVRRSKSALPTAVAVTGGLGGLGALFLAVASARLSPLPSAFTPDPEAAATAMRALMVHPDYAASLAGGFGLALALGGFGAALTLASRREKDDFGRDYYALALRHASWLLAAGGLIAGFQAGVELAGPLGMAAAPAFSPEWFQAAREYPILAPAIRCACCLSAAAGAVWTARAANPMRLIVLAAYVPFPLLLAAVFFFQTL